MSKWNGKTKVIGLCVTIFVILVGWGSSYVTKKVENGRAEQMVEDTVQDHTYWIQKLEENVEQLREDTTEIKGAVIRQDERLNGFEKQLDRIDDTTQEILKKL